MCKVNFQKHNLFFFHDGYMFCSSTQGTHPSLKGNAKALATVSAIIDGTGTIGAAVGPLLTGVLNPDNSQNGWNKVFLMLAAAEVVGALVSRSCLYKNWVNNNDSYDL